MGHAHSHAAIRSAVEVVNRRAVPRYSLPPSMSFYYLVSGFRLASEVELPTLQPVPAFERVDINFTLDSATVPSPSDWFLERRLPHSTRPFMLTARLSGGEYVMRLGDGVHFAVSADGGRIRAFRNETRPDVLEQLLLDQVLPQVMQLHGRYALHASSVALDGLGFAFVGPSGQGKSTLASAFVPPGLLLGDDCLALRVAGATVDVLPSYGSVRLCSDAVAELAASRPLAPASSRMTWKSRLPLPAAIAEVPLRRIFILARSEVVAIEPMSRAAAVAELAKQVHRLDPQRRAALLGEFQFLADVAERVPVSWLAYPHDFTRLGELRGAVLADLGVTPSTG